MELKKERGIDSTLRRRRGVNVVALPTVWDTTDYMWTETPATTLAMLFELDQAQNEGNQSFQFTAPRQPRSSSPNTGLPTQTVAPPNKVLTVLLAVPVHAFIYVDSQHIRLGKIGAAVLGSHVTREYKVLLYSSQQKEVTSARIHPGFCFMLQPGNYGSFYDEERQNWSVMFETEKATEDFCKQVCLAKWNSTPSLDSVVLQDLALGEGPVAQHGDSLEVSYTGYLLEDHTVGQMFKSTLGRGKPKRLRLGAGKAVKGLEEGILGLQKDGRRLLVVPSSLGYGSQGIPNLVPANSTLIFEMELHRIKPAKDNSPDLTPGEVQRSSLQTMACERPPRPTTAVPAEQGYRPLPADSGTEQLIDSATISKAELIARMAQVGQPVLPLLMGVVPALQEPEDSGTVDGSVKGYTSRLSMQPLTSSCVTSHSPNMAAVPLVALPPMSSNPQPVHPGANPPFQASSACTHPSVGTILCLPGGEMCPTEIAPHQVCDDTTFLVTEAWQQSTEIQQAVNKVAHKVDLLASQVESLQKQGCLLPDIPAVSLETSALLNSIHEITLENEGLKKDVSERNLIIEMQNMKIGELMYQNQSRYLEQNFLPLEERNESVQSASEHDQADRDKVLLTGEPASSSSRLSQLQQEVAVHQQKAAELESKLSAALQANKRHVSQLTLLNTQIKELKEGAVQQLTEKQGYMGAEAWKEDSWETEHLEKWCAEEMEMVHSCCSQRYTNSLRGQEEVCQGWCCLAQPTATPCHVCEWVDQQRVAQLQKQLHDKMNGVMNSVYYSLWGVFVPWEIYSGQTVLEVVAHTIKSAMLQTLTDNKGSKEGEALQSTGKVQGPSKEEDEEEPCRNPEARHKWLSLNGRQAGGEKEESSGP